MYVTSHGKTAYSYAAVFGHSINVVEYFTCKLFKCSEYTIVICSRITCGYYLCCINATSISMCIASLYKIVMKMKIKMKWMVLCFLFPFCVNAQIISTFAGGGNILGDGGLATSAIINDPAQLNFDKSGNLYIACGEGFRVRKIDTFGIITTIAGTGVQGNSGDSGLAINAKFNFPDGITIDTVGNIFIADGQYGSIRRIDAVTGIINTICGHDSIGYSGDGGPAINAKLYGPSGICFDKTGNLFIADCDNNVIRKINTLGIITTFAGTGVHGYNGDGITATSAELYLPTDVQADDSGNIYIADQGNARVRKVNTDGIISTYAGNGIGTFIEDHILAIDAQFIPTCIKFDSMKNLFITGNYRVFKVDLSGMLYTVAGNGVDMNNGDGGIATDASFLSGPIGLAIDHCGNLYLGNAAASADSDRIRKVSFNPACWPESVPQVVKNEVSIYPNPATEILNIDNVATPTRYAIINITGIIEQSGTLKTGNNAIPVQALPMGIHLLQLTNNEGAVTVHKIVKQ